MSGFEPNPLGGAGQSAQSSGSLRTKISLRAGVSTTVSPFYTMKPELAPTSALLGSSDLLSMYELASAYARFSAGASSSSAAAGNGPSVGGGRKLREDLNAFLPHLYGDFNFESGQDISWLKMLIEKPPITGKEISLPQSSFSSFKLQPGPVDEPYRYLFERRRDHDGYEEERREKPGRRFKMSLEQIEDERSFIAGTKDNDNSPPGSVQAPEREDPPEKKRHKGESSEKEKKQKKKKKDKKQKKDKEAEGT